MKRIDAQCLSFLCPSRSVLFSMGARCAVNVLLKSSLDMNFSLPDRLHVCRNVPLRIQNCLSLSPRLEHNRCPSPKKPSRKLRDGLCQSELLLTSGGKTGRPRFIGYSLLFKGQKAIIQSRFSSEPLAGRDTSDRDTFSVIPPPRFFSLASSHYILVKNNACLHARQNNFVP